MGSQIFNLNFNWMCRSCFKGSPAYITVRDKIDTYLKMTEFEAVKVIEDFRSENDIKCLACSHKHVRINNVKINDFHLYDFNRIDTRVKENDEELYKMFIGRENNIMEVSFGGFLSNQGFVYLDQTFEVKGKEKILNYLNSKPDNYFLKKGDSDLSITLSGSISNPKIESLDHIGFSREEIVKIIDSYVGYQTTKLYYTIDENMFWVISNSL